MIRTITFLSVLLIAQAGLAAALIYGDETPADRNAAAPLIAFDPGAVTRIALVGAGDGAVTVKRDGDRWVLVELQDFPADTEAVTSFLTTLNEIAAGWPVAETEEAAERFGVASNAAATTIDLRFEDGTSHTLLLGESPVKDKIYARVDGQREIYLVELSSREVGIEPRRWWDTDALLLSADDIRDVTHPNFTLRRAGDDYRIDELPEGSVVDAAAVKDLLDKIAAVRFVDIVTDAAAWTNAEPVLTLEVTLADDRQRRFEFRSSPENEGGYFLMVSDMPQVFEVTEAQLVRLRSVERARLIAPQEMAETPDAVPPPETESPSVETDDGQG